LAAKLISAFLLPPLSLLLPAFAGLLLLRLRPRLARWITGLSLLLLYVCATPFFADWALKSLETPALSRLDPSAEAIVVLGAGRDFDAPEYGGDTVKLLSLQRLRYAARLHRETGRPLLTTGGNPGGGTPEALLMKQVLVEDFNVPVRWTEVKAWTTRENARFSSQILRDQGISRVYLVTHAWHMKRAAIEFERAGLTVIPAGTGFITRQELRTISFLPNARALLNTYYASHEALGLLWYWVLASMD
jgi:uncharacterized SAM-binding protein YcdF (DUF218 family)